MNIASWGGFISIPNNLEKIDKSFSQISSAIFSILRIQLGILASEQKNFDKQKSILSLTKKFELEVVKHQLDHTIYHLKKTVYFINSLHDLKAKIEDLVISVEVAKMAWQAHSEFYKSYNTLVKNNSLSKILFNFYIFSTLKNKIIK